MSSLSEKQVPWWRRAVVYQVYLRSFADSDGDGTGDINGLRSRLDYLQHLGVDALWLNPWYRSPLADGGYDVADYRDIEPTYGTLADAEAFISEAHARDMQVIIDLVPNHTSEQHPWFIEACASPPGHPSRDRYHIRPGRKGGGPPTDWTSIFGGPAWTQLPDGEWYLHIFAKEQPDLNWEHPEVRAEFLSIFEFWLDRGADGIRVDVAHGLVKDPTFPDVGEEVDDLLNSDRMKNHPFWDRDGLHEIIRTWRGLLDTYEGDRMMVAEAWVPRDRLPLYLRPDEYHQSFNFDLLAANWDAAEFSEVITRASSAAASVGSAPTWVLSNHDVVRAPTRYGLDKGVDWRTWPVTGPPEALDSELGLRRARAAMLLLLGLPGSAYIYQGEELGLPEVWDLPPEVLDDPVWERSGGTRKGRDGCRVPLPWNDSGPSLGFGEAKPWLPQPEIWSEIGAEVQAQDPTSMLSLFKQAVATRKKLGAGDEMITTVPCGPDVVAYRRGSGLLCVVNFGSEPVKLPPHTEQFLCSQPDGVADGHLDRDCAVWIR